MVVDVASEVHAFARSNGFRPRRVAVLEWVATGLVAFGGSALAFPLTQGIVTGLGLVHLSLGLLGFPAGYGLWSRRAWGRGSVLALNAVTVAWSVLSESLLVFVLLSDERLYGSIGGTIVYLALASVIMYLLLRSTPGPRGV